MCECGHWWGWWAAASLQTLCVPTDVGLKPFGTTCPAKPTQKARALSGFRGGAPESDGFRHLWAQRREILEFWKPVPAREQMIPLLSPALWLPCRATDGVRAGCARGLSVVSCVVMAQPATPMLRPWQLWQLIVLDSSLPRHARGQEILCVQPL